MGKILTPTPKKILGILLRVNKKVFRGGGVTRPLQETYVLFQILPVLSSNTVLLFKLSIYVYTYDLSTCTVVRKNIVPLVTNASTFLAT
jgi:hypothetical protein